MGDKFARFYKQVAEAYQQAGGYNTVWERIEAGEFRDGLSLRKQGIAVDELRTYFEEHRTFGISEYDIGKLVTSCRRRQRENLVSFFKNLKNLCLFSN